MLPFLYLTTKGRASGKDHEIEIWYVEYNGKYYLLSGGYEKSDWVKNIRNNPNITFKVNHKLFQGTASIIKDPSLISLVKDLMAKAYRWTDGLPIELTPT
jgi:deazaflavin-dependent oxidoreductase (nitroreductase family)